MKFVVATYGTEGDTRPFLALCRGLLNAGHEARLLADSATLDSAHALGVPTATLAGNIRAALDLNHASLVAKGGGFSATAHVLAKIANENTGSWVRTIVDAGEGCDAIIVAGLAAFAGFSAAEYLGAHGVAAGMIPITPTAAFPSPFLASRCLPRALNRVSHRFVNSMLWRAFRGETNVARKALQLSPRRAVWKQQPTIYGISPNLLPRPTDWPSNVHLCGQWLTPNPTWTPPPSLANFLAAEGPPIYIGFGSMTGFDKVGLLDALIEAVAGRRALFHLGWSGVDPRRLPDNFFAVGDVPHDWLFPRTSAVIHHGGSGTSHSAARAGVPSIVVPFAGDQSFWAERLRLAGVAPFAISARRPNAAAFARALDFTTNPNVRRRAEALGEAMRAENGVADAIAALEAIVSAPARQRLRFSPRTGGDPADED